MSNPPGMPGPPPLGLNIDKCISKSMNRHCCVANTHALDHKTLNAHAQITKTDLNPGLEKPGQEKNYEMCERRAELKQDDIGVF